MIKGTNLTITSNMEKLSALHGNFCSLFMEFVKKLKNSQLLKETADTFYFGQVCIADKTETIEDSLRSKPPSIKQKSKK